MYVCILDYVFIPGDYTYMQDDLIWYVLMIKCSWSDYIFSYMTIYFHDVEKICSNVPSGPPYDLYSTIDSVFDYTNYMLKNRIIYC